MTLAELKEQLYGHVLDKIDTSRLYALEQMLWYLLPQEGLAPDDETIFDVVDELIMEAFVRAAGDVNRKVSHVPFGITREEEKAVEFDAGCRLCVMERKADAERTANAAHDAMDDCACCAAAAEHWRETNAEALRKAGLLTS